MALKSYWIFVAGFVLLMFVALSRSSYSRYQLAGYEGFASGSARCTMFGVDWCPHCVKAKPLFESLGSTMTIGGRSVSLQYVNPEKDKEAAAGYEIDGYPTIFLEYDGKRVKHSGPRTPEGFLQFLHKELGA